MSDPNRQCGSQPDASPELQHRQPKFTSGRWIISHEQPEWIDNKCVEIGSMSSPFWIAFVQTEESEANAHLIATAPRLFRALEALCALFDDPSPFYIKKLGAPITVGDQAVIDKAFVEAEEALREAEGRSL